MNPERFRLRNLSFTLRLAVTCLMAIIAGGYAASVMHIWNHYAEKDGRHGLSYEDLAANYHGVKATAPLIIALESDHGQETTPDEAERAALLGWLRGDRISEDYDNLDLSPAPADVLDQRCVSCHARQPTDEEGAEGIGETMPLEFWDDVKKVAFSRELQPVPDEILVVSTHTHALAMPLIVALTSLLLLATSWPKFVTHGLALLASAGLLVDIGGWWLARADPIWSYAVMVGGGVFGGAMMLQVLLAFLDMWFGRRR